MCCQILAQVLQCIANSLRKLMSRETLKRTRHSELKSIREFQRARNEAAYNGRYADFDIVVGQNAESNAVIHTEIQRFRVTRVLFAMASDTFEAMLYRENSPLEFEHRPSEIRITDVTPETFESVCRHVHELDPKFNAGNVLGVLRAADKFQMPKLVFDCKAFISQVIGYPGRSTCRTGMEVPLKILKSANELQRQYGPLPDVVNHAIVYLQDVIAVYGICFLEHELALDLRLDDVKGILVSSQLVSSEERIWDAIITWAERQSQQEGSDHSGKFMELARDLSKMVRFSDMRPDYFVENVIRYGVLSKDEVINIQSHWLHPSAVRAVTGNVARRHRIQILSYVGVERLDSRFTTHSAFRDSEPGWKSAIFLQAPSNEFKLELILACDAVSVDGPRFMLGMVPPTSFDRDLEMGDDLFPLLDTSRLLDSGTMCYGEGEAKEYLDMVTGLNWTAGTHLTMRYTYRTYPKLSFQTEEGGWEFLVRHVPPVDWIPCLLMYDAMSVNIIGLPEDIPKLARLRERHQR